LLREENFKRIPSAFGSAGAFTLYYLSWWTWNVMKSIAQEGSSVSFVRDCIKKSSTSGSELIFSAVVKAQDQQ